MENIDDSLDRFIPLINKMYGLYQFLDMDESTFFNLVVDGVKSYTYDEDGEVSFYDFYTKAIIEIINQYIKETLENKNYRVFINYIDTIWKDSDMNRPISYKKAITGLKRIDAFLNSLDSTLEIEGITNLISTNQKLRMVMDVVTAKDKDLIGMGNFSKYGKTTEALVEAYCIENGITFHNAEEAADDVLDLDDGLDLDIAEIGEDIALEDTSLAYGAKVANVCDTSSMDFLRQIIKEYPVLKPNEEKALIDEMLGGSSTAREKLIYSNFRLVISVAKKYIGRGVAFDDLFQEGAIGLAKAVDRYDPTRIAKLSTYARWWIRQAIHRYVEDCGRNIRIPVWTGQKIVQLNKTIDILTVEYGREPRIDEIARKMNLNYDQVVELYSYRTDTVSLNKRIGDDDTELEAFAVSPEGDLEGACLSPTMEEIMEVCKAAGLKEEEIDVLIRHQAFGDVTLEDIGKERGVTRERIRQIEERALKKIASSKACERLAIYTSAPDTNLEVIRRYRKTRPNGKYELGVKQIKVSVREEVSNGSLILGEIEEAFVAPKKVDIIVVGEKTDEFSDKKRGRKLKTVFEYLGVSPDDYYKYIEPQLTENEKDIVTGRYGTDLEHPDSSIKLTSKERGSFYNVLVPKMRRIATKAGLIESSQRKSGGKVSSGVEVSSDLSTNVEGTNHTTLEEAISLKRNKLEEAISLYERKEDLLARERKLDLEIASKLNGTQVSSKGKGKSS